MKTALFSLVLMFLFGGCKEVINDPNNTVTTYVRYIPAANWVLDDSDPAAKYFYAEIPFTDLGVSKVADINCYAVFSDVKFQLPLTQNKTASGIVYSTKTTGYTITPRSIVLYIRYTGSALFEYDVATEFYIVATQTK